MSKKFSRTDSNQVAIVKAFRDLGWSVMHCHELSNGRPDLVVGKWLWNVLVEVKDGSLPPSRRKLTPDEVKFHNEWNGDIRVINSVGDVVALDKEYAGYMEELEKLKIKAQSAIY